MFRQRRTANIDDASLVHPRVPNTAHGMMPPAARAAAARFGRAALSSSRSVAEKQRRAILDASGDLGAALGVGGFGRELEAVMRRVLTSRLVSRETRERCGLRHARGLLLRVAGRKTDLRRVRRRAANFSIARRHGPPGTGKTLIARGIAKLLSDRKPILVRGPEVFSHLLGASEQAVRGLFKPADDEWARMGSQSSLHVVVLDECDSILRKRGGGATGDGSFGGAARDGVVNQILAKLDGLDDQSNLLVIGTTNRELPARKLMGPCINHGAIVGCAGMDLIDPAALRPGRLEVHCEVALPDASGRREILALHAAKLGPALALDGERLADVLGRVADEKTQNFSGSELEAAVRNATSYALQRAVAADDPDAVVVTADDLLRGADEVVPVFGRARRAGPPAGDLPAASLAACRERAARVVATASTSDERRAAVALVGPRGARKRATAAAVLEDTPALAFQRTVAAAHLAGRDVDAARRSLVELFDDARRSPLRGINQ